MAVFGVLLSHENDPESALLLPDFSMFQQKLISLLLNGLRGLRNRTPLKKRDGLALRLERSKDV